MNEILIFFGILFIALFFEAVLTIFWCYDCKDELNKLDDEGASSIVAVFVVQAVINTIIIAVIASVSYFS